MSIDVDWSVESCPDCRHTALTDAEHASDQVEDGFTVYCTECGFAVEGRDTHMVQSAMLVLKRWSATR